MSTNFQTGKPMHAALSPAWVNEIWHKTPEQLYADITWNEYMTQTGRQSGGVMFARKMEALGDLFSEKQTARRCVLESLIARDRRSNLRVLTMPGLLWGFERDLMEARKFGEGSRTQIYCVERDPAIWFGAIAKMPGAEDGISQLSPHCIATRQIAAFYLTSVEAFVTDPNCPTFDAAWLDFTGQLTIPLAQKIKRFWLTRCDWQLTITSLNGRFHPDTNARIKRYGGLAEWLTHYLGSEPSEVFRYTDGNSPMLQITFRKERAR